MDTVQQKLLDKILQSKEFSNSSIYGNYLKYLIESTQEGKSLKETTIAIDVFGKDADFNPAEDTIVRSHTYTLRKKLEHYYFTEGKDDKLRLKIPKGHYEANFRPVSDKKYQAQFFIPLIKKNLSFLIIIVLAALSIFLWLKYKAVQSQLTAQQTFAESDTFWNDYFESDLPTLLVSGDHFMYNLYIKDLDRDVGVRDVLINSEQDLAELKTQHPDWDITPYPEPYFPYHSIWGLQPLFKLFYSNNMNPILRMSSDINPQILDEYNIIFVGSIKTLYILKHTLSETHFDFEISPHKIIYNDPESDSVKVYTTKLHSSGPNEDLVLAVKMQGPRSNPIFLIASYHSLGAPDIANFFVDPERRQVLEQKFRAKEGTVPKYFEVLFRVTGIDKTAYSTEILICNKLEKSERY